LCAAAAEEEFTWFRKAMFCALVLRGMPGSLTLLSEAACCAASAATSAFMGRRPLLVSVFSSGQFFFQCSSRTRCS
jgi:hypothetical protein